MDDWSPLEEDVLLKGTLLVRVTSRHDESPLAGKRVVVRGCGFVWGGAAAVTGRDGTVTLAAPLGKVEVTVGRHCEEAWIGVDLETEVEIRCWRPASDWPRPTTS